MLFTWRTCVEGRNNKDREPVIDVLCREKPSRERGEHERGATDTTRGRMNRLVVLSTRTIVTVKREKAALEAGRVFSAIKSSGRIKHSRQYGWRQSAW